MGKEYYSDTYDDIAWYNISTGQLGSWNIVNGAVSSWTTAGYATGSWYPVGLGNYSGAINAYDDVLWYNYSTGQLGAWQILDGGVTAWIDLGWGGGSWDVLNQYFGSMADTDFTNDGYDDVLWYNSSTGQVGIFDVFNGATSWQSLGYGSGSWSIVAVTDYVGDSSDDIIWFDYASGSVGAWNMTGGVPTWNYLGSAGVGWEIIGSGDFTADGWNDLVWGNYLTNQIGIWDGSNTGVTWRGLGYADLANWTLVGSGDYTNDGQDDLLWNSNSGETGYTDLFGLNSLFQSWQYLGTFSTSWYPT